MGIYMKFGDIVGDATQHVNKDNSGVEKVLYAGMRILGVSEAAAAAALGESGWIPLNDFHWHVHRQITNRAGKGAPSQTRGSIAPNVDEVTVEKHIDGTSCQLLQSFCEDNKGVDCTIVFIRTGDPGEIYLKYKLKNTLIQDINVHGKEDRPTETLKLNFTDIEVSVWRVDEQNVAQGPCIYEVHKDASQQGGGHPGHGGGHGHGPHH
jgi:type VI secretion system secreted protein Hcp